jgi:hypothetical protein
MIKWFLGIISTVVSIAVAWTIVIYVKVNNIEKQIRTKEDEIDKLEPDINGRTSGTLIVEKQRLAQIEKAKQPLLRDLERLEQERQFYLDKLPFFKK